MANLPLTELVVPDSEDVLVIGEEERADIETLQNKVASLEETTDGIPVGTYPELTAGSILSESAYSKDTTPYLYRAMPYVSKRLEDVIVGGSVVWNQLLNKANFAASETINGITFTNNADGSITVSGTATADARFSLFNNNILTAGHKYIVWGCPKNGSLSTYYISTDTGFTEVGNGVMISALSSYIVPRIVVKSGTTVSGLVFVPQLSDVTAHFGNATIADAIYAMEQAQAGSGIALLKASGFFNGYTPYDSGTLKSVNPTAHVTRGVNAWDEEWELGYFNTNTGEPTASTSISRSKNFIPCLPNTAYYYKSNGANHTILYYDKAQQFISLTTAGGADSQITTPANCYYMKFAFVGTTYNHDICININNPTINGKYFPYEEHTYPLGDVVLRGIPKLVNNELVYDGDIYQHDGSVTRKYGVVDLGSLDWTYQSTNTRFYSDVINDLLAVATDDTFADIVSAKYTSSTTNRTANSDYDKIIATSTSKRVFVKDTTYTTAAAFKTAMSGVYLVYELATPTTETTTPFEQYQVCETGGTEEYTTTNEVPVGHDTKYFTDLAKKIADLPFDMSMIAPVEETYTATRNYAVGDYLIVDNTFYKVTSAIANGRAITPNTNVTATTVATELIALR